MLKDAPASLGIGSSTDERAMTALWYEPIESLCADICVAAAVQMDPRVPAFYVARWCQKQTGDDVPDLNALEGEALADTAARVLSNLVCDGPTVDALVTGDASQWTALRRNLMASARPRVFREADDYVDEALQKIAIVLLTGTPPALAIDRLAEGPLGPRNEYVFTSPFSFWAKAVVINLIVEDARRKARVRRGTHVRAVPNPAHDLDRETMRRACAALPGLLEAVRSLPPTQRAVMAFSLQRRALDPLVVQHLHELAPDLFSPDDHVADDAQIAARLGTTPRLVAANRSVARCRLAAQDPLWALLLDVLMPHKSTRRPTKAEVRDE